MNYTLKMTLLQFRHPVADVIVDGAGRRAGHDQRPDLIEDLRCDPPGRVHAMEILRLVNADTLAGLACLVHGVLVWLATEIVRSRHLFQPRGRTYTCRNHQTRQE